jgi:uncharacterized membrane protein HdeD (DUF308 family)
MKCNVGSSERIIRILVGAILVTLAFTHQLGLWAWIGVVPLFTGIVRFCPLYALIKRNGCCGAEDKSGCSK